MRNKIVAAVLVAGVTLGLGVAVVVQPAGAAPVTPVATTAPPPPNVAVLVDDCEDTDADVLCAYYDDTDEHVGVPQWWLYPHYQTAPDVRVPIDECPTEDSDTLTCLWPSYALGAFLVYLPIDLTAER